MAISNEYWEEYVNPSDQFALIASPDVLSVKSPGGSSVGSPATPEYRPVPESPFLGPINSPVRQPSERFGEGHTVASMYQDYPTS